MSDAREFDPRISGSVLTPRLLCETRMTSGNCASLRAAAVPSSEPSSMTITSFARASLPQHGLQRPYYHLAPVISRDDDANGRHDELKNQGFSGR